VDISRGYIAIQKEKIITFTDLKKMFTAPSHNATLIILKMYNITYKLFKFLSTKC